MAPVLSLCEKNVAGANGGISIINARCHKFSIYLWKVGPTALGVAHYDEKMELLFKAGYAVLPFPVHLAVQDPAFVEFCFAHRDRLLSPGETAAAAMGR